MPFSLQEASPAIIENNDAVTGQIISTTIGGKNGEPKQVTIAVFSMALDVSRRSLCILLAVEVSYSSFKEASSYLSY